ncbi:MAG: HAD family hydrolase [Chloroflexi bacterium]|nr:HAD family hydrolase [Chloroflexota bacterium]
MSIRAVLFDVGGPIDTEVEHERLIDIDIRAALAAEGVVVSGADFLAANDWAVESFAPNAYTAIMFRLAGGDAVVAARAYAWLSARSEQRRRARSGLELRPGVADLLRALHGRGVLLGLAANQPAAAVDDLDRLGLGRLFHHRQVSAHHGFRKPDPRLFLAALDDLEVAPAETVMVGDRVDNDIAPARSLGMETVLFRTGRHIRQQPRSWEEAPHHEVGDVAGLERVLAAMLPRL